VRQREREKKIELISIKFFTVEIDEKNYDENYSYSSKKIQIYDGKKIL